MLAIRGYLRRAYKTCNAAHRTAIYSVIYLHSRASCSIHRQGTRPLVRALGSLDTCTQHMVRNPQPPGAELGNTGQTTASSLWQLLVITQLWDAYCRAPSLARAAYTGSAHRSKSRLSSQVPEPEHVIELGTFQPSGSTWTMLSSRSCHDNIPDCHRS